MGRPPVKSTIALTKAKTKAELQARASWKSTKAGWDSSIRDHIGHWIDNIDPLELVASLGLALTIYDLIKNTEEFLVAASNAPSIGYVGLATPIIQGIIDLLYTRQALTPEQTAKIDEIKNTVDYVLFLKSYGLAFILVRNSGAILNGLTTAGGGLSSYVAGALGLAVIA